MESKFYRKAGILALLLCVTLIFCWELFWRQKGYIPTFNDDKALWADKRKEVYKDPDKTTVVIGSSRIKFDLDIDTWEKTTGEELVQLSVVGTSPRLLLKDLADDMGFKGKLIIDITEILFFSQNPAFHHSAKEAIAFYNHQTVSEKASSRINFGLEAKLAFLEERRFSLNTLLKETGIENRPGVFTVPPFPKGFEWTNFDRQTYMSEMFLSNINDIRRQTSIWNTLIMSDPTPPVNGKELEEILKEVMIHTDKIRARGGKIIFVRTPSSGPMKDKEFKTYPRELYWEALLKASGSEGIHFMDYPETRILVCPEWSHLSIEQAIDYTKHLIEVLDQKGWFKNSNKY